VIKLLLVFFSGLLALTVVISACKPAATSSSLTENERLELVKEIKAFQKKLGFNPTENFASVSDNKEEHYNNAADEAQRFPTGKAPNAAKHPCEKRLLDSRFPLELRDPA